MGEYIQNHIYRPDDTEAVYNIEAIRGYILRRNEKGEYVLQAYCNVFLPINDPSSLIFKTPGDALIKYELLQQNYPEKYGLAVRILDITKCQYP